MATVSVADLVTFREGTKAVSQQHAAAVLAVVTAVARTCTRGRGFTSGEPDDALAAVIITASVRMLADTQQTRISLTKGPQSAMFDAGFTGWSTAELAALNAYRIRAK